MSNFEFIRHDGHLTVEADEIARAHGARHITCHDADGCVAGYFTAPWEGRADNKRREDALRAAIDAAGGLDSLRFFPQSSEEMTISLFFILGAPDPEMEAIETLLRDACVAYGYATVSGERVRGGSAYHADGVSDPVPHGARIFSVECGGPAIRDSGGGVRVVDHHRPGDPGYGRGPREFWPASSLGQVVRALRQHGASVTRDMPRLRLIAAADHCLSHAYRYRCPGISGIEVAAHRNETRSAWQGRPVEALVADIGRAAEALRAAPEMETTPDPECPECGGTGLCAGDEGDEVACPVCATYIADMRGRPHLPEMGEASAQMGQCFVADGLPGPDGRVKVSCASGSPEEIRAFQRWAVAQGLVDIYGDPARGFAGGYVPA